MHHPYDQLFKALMGACLDLSADVELERVVHVPPQRIDVAFEPRTRVPALGITDRMAALGAGMFEYYSRGPSEADVKACLRKRLNYDHERALAAGRRSQPSPPEPRLWLLSADRSDMVLRAHPVVPMAGWPAGFWQSRIDDRVHVVVIDELPAGNDTLLLRLLGHGPTLQRALAELAQLPGDHVLDLRARPVLVAFRPAIMQHLNEAGDMNAVQQAEALYREWEQRMHQQGRDEEARALLMRLLARRFGAVPDEVSTRVQHADRETIEGWAEQVLVAASLDDVFA